MDESTLGWAAEGTHGGENNTTPINSLRVSQERLQLLFCSNILPSFATDTYKYVAQESLNVANIPPKVQSVRIKKLLPLLLGTPEGIYGGCIIFSPKVPLQQPTLVNIFERWMI